MNAACKSAGLAAIWPAAVWMAALAIGAVRLAPAQDALRPIREAQGPQSLSQNASAYFEMPVAKLKGAVPELRGLRFDAGQERLLPVLAGVAKTIEAVLPRLPDLASREDVYHFSAPDSAFSGLASAEPWSRQFRYLILTHHNSDGSTTINELRTDSKGRTVDRSGDFTTPSGYGFANEWLFFRAANQREFRFRYLGEQDKEGRMTFVVVFAQDPAKVTNPAHFQSQGKTAPFFYQGVLWIDQSSFDIVMLRTDLLAPLPDLSLRQMTTEVTFHSVPIRGFGEVFWLPSQVYLSNDQGAGPVEETHRYSDYHLFHAEVRIVDSP